MFQFRILLFGNDTCTIQEISSRKQGFLQIQQILIINVSLSHEWKSEIEIL